MTGTIYCLDTSALIHAEVRAYPIALFPGVWSKLSELIRDGRAFAPLEVLKELEKKEDQVYEWCRQRKLELIVQPTEEIQIEVASIVEKFPSLVENGRGAADPFVVATARVKGCTVVTQEFQKPSKPKIPDVCDALSIARIDVLGLIRAEGWVL